VLICVEIKLTPKNVHIFLVLKGTVLPVLSWLTIVWLNVVISGDGPRVVF
jgi:hypothetical protein